MNIVEKITGFKDLPRADDVAVFRTRKLARLACHREGLSPGIVKNIRPGRWGLFNGSMKWLTWEEAYMSHNMMIGELHD